MGIRGIRCISSSHSHSHCHSHSLTITNNGFHKGGPARSAGPPLWRRPKAASIVGDGEAANIAKTYAYTYQMCPHFLLFSLRIPAAIFQFANHSHVDV